MSLIPVDWMPEASMERIITHWTVGSYTPNSYEKSRYHILIDGDNGLHRGKFSMADNDRDTDALLRAPNTYAAHTKGTNSQSIGVTVCCMSGMTGRSNFGRFPMKQSQWEQMAVVVGELCRHYDIPITEKTVLGHGEVEKKLGIAQNGKIDPMILPWDSAKSFDQVGNMFRDRIRFHHPPMQNFVFTSRIWIHALTWRASLEVRFDLRGWRAGLSDHPLGRNRWSCLSQNWGLLAKKSYGYFWYENRKFRCFDTHSSKEDPAFTVQDPPKWHGDMSNGGGWILRPRNDRAANEVIKWQRID